MNNYNRLLIDYYNECYKSYLSNINPTVFLHILLDNIIKLINAKCAIIMRYDNNSEQLNILEHVSNNIKYDSSNRQIYFSDIHNTNNNWFIFSSFMDKNKRFDKNCVIMKSIIEQTIMIKEDCKFEDIFGFNIENSVHNNC